MTLNMLYRFSKVRLDIIYFNLFKLVRYKLVSWCIIIVVKKEKEKEKLRVTCHDGPTYQISNSLYDYLWHYKWDVILRVQLPLPLPPSFSLISDWSNLRLAYPTDTNFSLSLQVFVRTSESENFVPESPNWTEPISLSLSHIATCSILINFLFIHSFFSLSIRIARGFSFFDLGFSFFFCLLLDYRLSDWYRPSLIHCCRSGSSIRLQKWLLVPVTSW